MILLSLPEKGARTTMSFPKVMLMLFAVALLSVGSIKAQEVPATFTTVPSTYYDGDTITVQISVGTSADPLVNATEVEVVFQCDGCTIDPVSPLHGDFSGTSFPDPEDWEMDFSIAAAGDEMTITMNRTNGVGVNGYGFIAGSPGVIVQIDDLLKGPNLGLRMTSMSVNGVKKEAFSANVYPNPSKGLLNLDGLDPDQTYQVQLISLTGARVHRTELSNSERYKLDYHSFPAGLYLLEIEGNGNVQRKKIQLN
ncbi:MAG: T9SS type A sorting domain-containing protein [Bacteroidia bacterium]|nr:T9SS type A sorting domain-containing protein [Bacteroidia bacterium]